MLCIQQRYCSDGRGGTELGFGASVYNASIALSFYLEANPLFIKNKIVIELGCGPGLVSIAASILEAKFVIPTDGDETSLNLTQTNINTNIPALSERCIPRKLNWGDMESLEAIKTDLLALAESITTSTHELVVLASDVVALPYINSYDDLILTLYALCVKASEQGSQKIGVVLLSYQRRHHSDNLFWAKMKRRFDIRE